MCLVCVCECVFVQKVVWLLFRLLVVVVCGTLPSMCLVGRRCWASAAAVFRFAGAGLRGTAFLALPATPPIDRRVFAVTHYIATAEKTKTRQPSKRKAVNQWQHRRQEETR